MKNNQIITLLKNLVYTFTVIAGVGFISISSYGGTDYEYDAVDEIMREANRAAQHTYEQIGWKETNEVVYLERLCTNGNSAACNKLIHIRNNRLPYFQSGIDYYKNKNRDFSQMGY